MGKIAGGSAPGTLPPTKSDPERVEFRPLTHDPPRSPAAIMRPLQGRESIPLFSGGVAPGYYIRPFQGTRTRWVFPQRVKPALPGFPKVSIRSEIFELMSLLDYIGRK